MLVHQILKSKANQELVTIVPEASVSDAARILSERRIGTVVVSVDRKTPLGILSERDIVRELGRRGSGCMTDSVEALMTRKVITCGPDDKTEDVLAKMTDGRFRHMPVVRDGALIGLISLGDVVKAQLSELAMEKDALQGMIMGH